MAAGSPARHARIAIIGTGFGGVAVACRLKKQRVDDFVIFERSREVGGTWRDNTYPGCQCDVPSHLYSFSFAPNPNWSRTYSPQPEILDYLKDCARRFGVLDHVRFGHKVESAAWDEGAAVWRIETSQGPWTANIFISAHGGLSEPAIPSIEGIERFEGESLHSGEWGPDVDLAAKRVAVIGTGASAIQIVPHIQKDVESLYVFQRTAAWVLPHTDRRVTERERRVYRRFPFLQRLVRGGVYALREAIVPALTKNRRLAEPLRAYAKRHLRRQVKDPELLRKLTPGYSPGCKRLLLSNEFYPALTKPNVDVVTDPIKEITTTGIATVDGAEREVDVVIYATGFRVTDNPIADVIKGRDGASLADVWRENGMRAYLGTTVNRFPNLFLVTGPNTGIGHTSLLVMIEAQARYIADCIAFMDERRVGSVEVRQDILDRFNDELSERLRRTVWNAGRCSSWYLDEKGRNPTMWPDFTWRFLRRTLRFHPQSYPLVPGLLS